MQSLKGTNLKVMDGQVFTDENRNWRISRLIQLSSELEVFFIPLKHLNIYNLYPKISSTMDFVRHVRRVNEADLSHPIILDEEGYPMDGRHRIAKALLLGKESISAVRFDKTPPYDYIIEDKNDSKSNS